jgi:hypothetical protein
MCLREWENREPPKSECRYWPRLAVAGYTATPMQEALCRKERSVHRPEMLLQPEGVASAVVQAVMLPPFRIRRVTPERDEAAIGPNYRFRASVKLLALFCSWACRMDVCHQTAPVSDRQNRAYLTTLQMGSGARGPETAPIKAAQKLGCRSV